MYVEELQEYFTNFFADDGIIFCRVTVEEGSKVMKVLEDYESDSGQKLNKEKIARTLAEKFRIK